MKPVTDPLILQQLEQQAESSFARSQLLGTRSLFEGAMTLPAMGADLIGMLLNQGVRGYNRVTGGQVPQFRPQAQVIGENLTAAGLPEPQTATERVIADINRGAGSALTSAGAAGALRPAGTVARGALGALAEAPGLQTLAGATSGAASGLTREAGGGPLAQLAAGAAGATVPSIGRLASDAVRVGVRGTSPATVRQNLADFTEAGTVPTVGQATQGRGARATESFLSRMPGSAGRMAAKGEAQQAQIGSRVLALAHRLSARTDATAAGRAIDRGVTGFVDTFKQRGADLYNNLDQFVPAATPSPVANTRATLAKLATPIAGAEKTSALLSSPKVRAITEAFEADSASGAMPYQALKELRTMVGNLLASDELISDVPRAQLKQVYGAITRDMQDAATAAGPEAVKALKRANTYWAGGLERIDHLERVVNKVDFERVFEAAVSGTKEGATTLRTVMKSIPNEGREAVTATLVKRMGRSSPGQQVATGDAFSTETFLTNWNRLSPEAKLVLFTNDDLRKGLDAVSRVAQNIRAGSKVFANPSGTGQAVAQYTGAGALVLAALTGHWREAGVLAGGMTGANLSARLMSSPRFVRWLADSAKVPAELLPAQLNALVRQASTDQEREDFGDLAMALSDGQPSPAQSDRYPVRGMLSPPTVRGMLSEPARVL